MKRAVLLSLLGLVLAAQAPSGWHFSREKQRDLQYYINGYVQRGTTSAAAAVAAVPLYRFLPDDGGGWPAAYCDGTVPSLWHNPTDGGAAAGVTGTYSARASGSWSSCLKGDDFTGIQPYDLVYLDAGSPIVNANGVGFFRQADILTVRSEELDNAAYTWAVLNGACGAGFTVSADQSGDGGDAWRAPDGTFTAERIQLPVCDAYAWARARQDVGGGFGSGDVYSLFVKQTPGEGDGGAKDIWLGCGTGNFTFDTASVSSITSVPADGTWVRAKGISTNANCWRYLIAYAYPGIATTQPAKDFLLWGYNGTSYATNLSGWPGPYVSVTSAGATRGIEGRLAYSPLPHTIPHLSATSMSSRLRGSAQPPGSAVSSFIAGSRSTGVRQTTSDHAPYCAEDNFYKHDIYHPGAWTSWRLSCHFASSSVAIASALTAWADSTELTTLVSSGGRSALDGTSIYVHTTNVSTAQNYLRDGCVALDAGCL